MLLNNQRITLDFASKAPVKINNIMYKEGEKDRDGIVIKGLNVSIQETDSVVVYWLYSTQDLYIFVPTLGERISETEIKTLPPRGVLQKGEVGVEVIVLGADGSELKSQSGYIPVQASLIQEDYSGDADDDVSITMQLIAQATDLHQAAIALNAQMATAHQGRIDAENLREGKFDAHEANLIQKRDGVASATSATNTAKDGVNTAKTNADSKASLANSKATLAQTAATNANNAKAAADSSVASAGTIKSQLETSTSSANTAKTNADSKASLANTKATLANDKATLANTAAVNADNAKNKAAAIPGEIVKARTGMDGVVYANLNERLRKDFEFIGKKLPVSKTSSGNGEIVFDGSLSGDVSSTVATGQTLVNVWDKKQATNATVEDEFVVPKGNSVANYMAGGGIPPKPNSSYTIVVFVEELSLPSGGVVNFVSSGLGVTTSFAVSFKNFTFATTGTYVINGTALSDLTGKSLWYGTWYSVADVGNRVKYRVLILEGDHTDKPLEFFEGLKSAEVSEINTHGVNLVESKYESTSYHTNRFNIPLDPSKRYRMFWNAKNDSPSTLTNARLILGNTDNTFENTTYLSDQYWSTIRQYTFTGKTYVSWRYSTGTGSITLKEFAIVEVTPNTPTEYIPYTSSKVTLSEPIILRSLPNGVADTYDFDTQTLTRRCGEVVLNGSEDGWVFVDEHFSGYQRYVFNHDIVNSNSYGENKLISDRFQTRVGTITIGEHVYTALSKIGITIDKTRLSSQNISGFKAWLQANPTTVVYELITPTSETVEASGQLRSYDYQTTIRTDSVIPPKITATAPIDFTTSLATITNGISTVSNNDNAEYLSTEMSNIHDELNAIKATLVITPEA